MLHEFQKPARCRIGMEKAMDLPPKERAFAQVRRGQQNNKILITTSNNRKIKMEEEQDE